jgi:hypothetical protein
MDITTATPAQIDEAWFPIMAQRQRAEDAASDYRDHAAKEDARALTYRADQYRAQAAKYDEQAEALRAQEAPYAAEWDRRGGWTRYPMVTNKGGHAHTSTHCQTCRFDTSFAYLTEASGMTAKKVVKLLGEGACTVCFPDAPVGPRTIFTAEEKVTRAEALERAEALAAKKAAAAAKSITMPDGAPLKDDSGYPVKTERMAEINAAQRLADDAWYGLTHPSRGEWLAYVERAVQALAAKRGTTVQVQRDLVEANAAKKIAKH